MTEYVLSLGIDPGFAMTGCSAVAMLPDGSLLSAGAAMVRTEKNKDKRFERQRVSMDDSRRFREFYDAFSAMVEKMRPHVIGVECYTIFDPKNHDLLRENVQRFMAFLGLARGAKPAFTSPSEFLQALAAPGMFDQFLAHLIAMSASSDAFRAERGRGDAHKTFGVYLTVLNVAFRYNIPAYGYMPVDLKKFACGKASASKEEVIAALDVRVPNLRDKVTEKGIARGQHNHVYDATGHALLALNDFVAWQKEGIRHGNGAWTPGENT